MGINVYVGRWNIGTFFRLYLGSILPENIAKVIYLDCDTIVRHPLSDVYNLDLGNAVVAGVDDCRSDLYRVDIDIKPGSIYINNGFLLMDLSKIRKENIEQEFNKYIAYCKGDCTYMDQAPLNHVLSSNGRIYQLPAKYNAQRIFFDFTFDELMKLRKPNFHLSKEEYDEAINDPIVVHFTPVFISGTRPRQKKDKHKFTPEYRHYKSISEWKEIPYRNDDRKIPKKIMTIICKLTPRKLMIKIMSYLHATWYPNKRINKRKKLGY